MTERTPGSSYMQKMQLTHSWYMRQLEHLQQAHINFADRFQAGTAYTNNKGILDMTACKHLRQLLNHI